MNHPLTDEIIEEIFNRHSTAKETLRAIYDRGFDDAIELITQRMGLAPFSATIEAKENFYNQQ